MACSLRSALDFPASRSCSPCKTRCFARNNSPPSPLCFIVSYVGLLTGARADPTL